MVKARELLKEQLLETVEVLREEGIDLAETPAVFTWSYEEEPWIEFQLFITEAEEMDLNTEGQLH